MSVEIINDDCLKILKNIKAVDLIITDPPYFVIPKGKKTCKGHDNFKWDNFDNMQNFLKFTKEWFDLCFNILKNDSFMYIFWSQKYFQKGFEIFNPNRVLLWHYRNLVLGGNGDFAYDYEPIFVIKKGNPKLIKGKHSSILNFTKPQSNFKGDRLVHPTQKPLKLIEHLISISNLKENAVILDPFGGGGAAALASNNLKYDCTTIEKEAMYCDLIKID
ncbi:site-specific DNA-methyltransferase [Campylobacter coli]|nr:site-specific DNA-methyltransferase [Campylobacter coli]